MPKTLLQALKEINWEYGRGDLVSYTLNANGLSGFVTRYIPTGQNTGFEENRKFVIVDGHKVRFCGRTRNFN